MTSFEQTQSIVTRIQQILRDYPYGNAVLLELLQNADDAKAKSAQAVFEAFSANEHNPAARSPALLFYNSATFTERDLQNIQNIGGLEETSKRHDATKVGRFGIGFNSSFHVADCVAFVTGNELIVFDPARENLPPLPHGARTGGMKWNIPTFETDSRFSEEQKQFAREVLQAFELSGMGFKRGSFYNGTIFRLPLRPKPSALWKEVHRPADIAKLMIEFFESATLGMVVLKNIESISAKVHRKGPHGPMETLFEVTAAMEKDAHLKAQIVNWLQEYTAVVAHVMDETDKVTITEHYHRDRVNIQKRSVRLLPRPKLVIGETVVTLVRGKFLSVFSEAVNTSWETSKEFFSAVDNAQGETKDQNGEGDEKNKGTAALVEVGAGGGEDIIQFQIAHQFGPGDGWENSRVWEIASHSAQCRHPVDVPWSATIINVCGTVDDGRLMCFFPIRQGTMLPVHIHGYFHVSSDRQSIKGLNDTWNAALVDEVIPYAYAAAITEVRKFKSKHFYKLWPTLKYTDETVKAIAKRTLALLANSSCVAGSDGTWGPISRFYFPFFSANSGFYRPSQAFAASVHCLVVSASARCGAPVATFPNIAFNDGGEGQAEGNETTNAPPSIAQMDELWRLAIAFKDIVRTLNPIVLKQLLQYIPPNVTLRYFSTSSAEWEGGGCSAYGKAIHASVEKNVGGKEGEEAKTNKVLSGMANSDDERPTLLAMELFLMCTVGVPAQQIAQDQSFYSHLPIIPLAFGGIRNSRTTEAFLRQNEKLLLMLKSDPTFSSSTLLESGETNGSEGAVTTATTSASTSTNYNKTNHQSSAKSHGASSSSPRVPYVAFVDQLSKEVPTSLSQTSALSSRSSEKIAANTTNLFSMSTSQTPCLICKTPAGLAFATEAFSHRVVKTLITMTMTTGDESENVKTSETKSSKDQHSKVGVGVGAGGKEAKSSGTTQQQKNLNPTSSAVNLLAVTGNISSPNGGDVGDGQDGGVTKMTKAEKEDLVRRVEGFFVDEGLQRYLRIASVGTIHLAALLWEAVSRGGTLIWTRVSSSPSSSSTSTFSSTSSASLSCQDNEWFLTCLEANIALSSKTLNAFLAECLGVANANVRGGAVREAAAASGSERHTTAAVSGGNAKRDDHGAVQLLTIPLIPILPLISDYTKAQQQKKKKEAPENKSAGPQANGGGGSEKDSEHQKIKKNDGFVSATATAAAFVADAQKASEEMKVRQCVPLLSRQSSAAVAFVNTPCFLVPDPQDSALAALLHNEGYGHLVDTNLLSAAVVKALPREAPIIQLDGHGTVKLIANAGTTNAPYVKATSADAAASFSFALADQLVAHFARSHKTFLAEDVEYIKALPIYVTVDNHLVPLKPKNAAGDSRQHPPAPSPNAQPSSGPRRAPDAVMLPSSINEIITSAGALCGQLMALFTTPTAKEDASSSPTVKTNASTQRRLPVDIIAEGSASTVYFLENILGVGRLTKVEFLACAAAIYDGPPLSACEEGSLGKWLWTNLIRELLNPSPPASSLAAAFTSGVARMSAEVFSDLLRQLLSYIKERPLFVDNGGRPVLARDAIVANSKISIRTEDVLTSFSTAATKASLSSSSNSISNNNNNTNAMNASPTQVPSRYAESWQKQLAALPRIVRLKVEGLTEEQTVRAAGLMGLATTVESRFLVPVAESLVLRMHQQGTMEVEHGINCPMANSNSTPKTNESGNKSNSTAVLSCSDQCKSFGCSVRNYPLITHSEVSHLLELIAAAAPVTLASSGGGTDTNNTLSVVEALSKIPFVPTLDYVGLLKYRKKDGVSAPTKWEDGLLTAPKLVTVETVYRSYPYPQRNRKCLHPWVVVSGDPARTINALFGWSEPPSFEVLVGFSHQAAEDCARRRAEAAVKHQKKQTDEGAKDPERKVDATGGRNSLAAAGAGGSYIDNPTSSLHFAEEGLIEAPPPQFDDFFIKETYKRLENYLAGANQQALSEYKALLMGGPKIKPFQMYFPSLDAVGTAQNMCFNAKAARLSPLFTHINSTLKAELRSLFTVLGVRMDPTPDEIVAAINMIPSLRDPRVPPFITSRQPAPQSPQLNDNGKTKSGDKLPAVATTATPSPTSVMLMDSDRELFRDALEYLTAILKRYNGEGIAPATSAAATSSSSSAPQASATSAAEQHDSKQVKEMAEKLLVPTADGKSNFADKVFYDYYNLEIQEKSSTVLWNGILPVIARSLGIRHTGLNVLSQLNTMGKSRGRGSDGSRPLPPGIQAGGQRLSLLNGIKRILSDYSEPTALLFEMIQNADDAGATKIEFILDQRAFKADGPPEGFFGTGMQKQQGPALIIKNDAVFKPEDFEAIHDIGVGHKSTDASKIGRYGVGFNSVYHITDCPSIVSADKLLIFDPSITNIDIATPSEPGLVLEHAAVPNLADHFPQQLQPYETHGVSFGQYYNGTLFRLPLRTKPSAVSQAVVTTRDILLWFQEFQAVAGDLTLFLKSLETVQVTVISASGLPTPHFSSKIKNTERVRRYRKELSEKCAYHVYSQCQQRRDMGLPTSTPLNNPSAPDTNRGEPTASNAGDGALSIISDSVSTDFEIEVNGSTRLFRVFSLVDKPPIDITVPSDLANKLSCSATVAVSLTSSSPLGSALTAAFSSSVSSSLSTSSSQALPAPSDINGRLHAFLPLPSKTLPFHAHAIFAVSSDRKGVWTNNVTNANSWDVVWNRHLMHSVIPRCFIGCMTTLRQNAESLNDRLPMLWRCWPSAEGDTQPIAASCAALACHHNAPILPAAHPPSLVAWRDCLFGTSDAIGEAREAVLAVLKATSHPFVAVPAAYNDLFAAVGPEKVLGPKAIIRILKQIAGSQSFVPYAAVFPTNERESAASATRNHQLYTPLITRLEKYCENAQANLVGLPLTQVKTFELAVIREENPCFDVQEDQLAKYKTLCPHLSERNILVDKKTVEKHFRFKFSAASLVVTFPTLSRMRGYHFLADPRLRVGGSNNASDPQQSGAIQWEGPTNSPAGVWLAQFWDLMTESDVNNEALARYPIIPVRALVDNGRVASMLRAPCQRKLISNGSQGLRVLSELVSKLRVENVDISFSKSDKVITLLKCKALSLEDVVMRAAQSPEVFEEFSPQDVDAIRRALLASQHELPFGIRDLPIFKVYQDGKVRHSTIDGDTQYAIPDGAPLTALCEGLLVEPCTHKSLSVRPISIDVFVTERFLPSLGLLALTDELANWRYVRRMCITNTDLIRTVQSTPGAMDLVAFPTSLAPSKALSSPPGMPLTAQILKYICHNELAGKFDHPILSKYQTFLRHVALSTVSVSRRAREYVLPISDRCTHKPLAGVLHQLHTIFASQNLLTICPLPPVLAADEDLVVAFREFRKPAKETDAIIAILHCYLALLMSGAKGKEWLVRQLAANRELKSTAVDPQDVLSVLTLSVALEIIACVEDNSLGLPSAQPPAQGASPLFTSGPAKETGGKIVIGSLPVCSVLPYADEATERIRESFPLSARKCPSKLPKLVGEKHRRTDGDKNSSRGGPMDPLYSPKKPQFLPISMCVKYSERMLCWTQFDILHPLLDSAKVLEKHTAKVTIPKVLAHIVEMIEAQQRIPLSVIQESLKRCYEFLASKKETELLEVPNIQTCTFCALPPDSEGVIRTVPIEAIVDLTAVKSNYERHESSLSKLYDHVSLAPHYYTLMDDFPECHQLARVVRLIKPPALPRPREIIGVLKRIGLEMNSLSGSRRQFSERQYESVLRILIVSCRHYTVRMEWYDAKEIIIDLATTAAAGVNDGNSERSYAINIAAVPVPLWHGQGLIPSRDACLRDDVALVERLSHAARITCLPPVLCAQMRIQPASLRITETPSRVRPFSLEESLALQKSSDASTGPHHRPRSLRPEHLKAVADAIVAFNAFFPSTTFARAVERIASTNAAKKGPRIADPSVATKIRVIPVSELATKIVDSRFPNDAIYLENPTASEQSTMIASNLSTREIFVNPVAVVTHRAPLEGLIAKEIGKILGGSLVDLMPITSLLNVLATEARYRGDVEGGHRFCHWHVDVDKTLDLLGCIADERRRTDPKPGMASYRDDAALLRLAECTGIDYVSSYQDAAEKRRMRVEALTNSCVVDRFLVCKDHPFDFLDQIAASSMPRAPESHDVCERDLALFYSTPLTINLEKKSVPSQVVFRTESVPGKGDMVVGGLEEKEGTVRHFAAKTSVMAAELSLSRPTKTNILMAGSSQALCIFKK